jgi:RHS repeat-associated protein
VVNRYYATPFGNCSHDLSGNRTGVTTSSIKLGIQTDESRKMKYDCFGRAARFDYQRFGSWPPPPVSVVLTYDALGRLAGRMETQGSSVRSAKYAYGGDNPWQLLEERRVTAGVAEPPVTYVQGPGIDDILSVRDQHGELFLCADDQSSVLAAADRDGLVLERYSYDDFGRPETRTETYGAGLPAGRNAHLFTGRRWDAVSGLYDYRTRWYDPSPGRFISRDTIGIWGDPANLGNPYTYVANNPATWVDPWGRWSVWAPWTWGDPTPEGHTWWGFGNPQARPWNFLRENVRTFSTWWEEGWVNGSLNGQISRIPGNHCVARTVMWGGLASSAVAAATAGAGIAWELAAHFGLAGYQELAENATAPRNAGARLGGAYDDVSAAGGQVHHAPADSISPLSRGKGPSFRMDTPEHHQTASWGRSKAAQAYRTKQQELIGQGRFREAQQMDIDDVRSKFGPIYDEHIRQMEEYTDTLDPNKLKPRGTGGK